MRASLNLGPYPPSLSIKPSAPHRRTADQFKMLPMFSLFPNSSPPPLLLLLLPLLVTSSALGCTKWDSCEEPEHYCYQVAAKNFSSQI